MEAFKHGAERFDTHRLPSRYPTWQDTSGEGRFLLGRLHWLSQLQHALCTNEGFRSKQQTVHTHTLTLPRLSLLCIFTRAPASHQAGVQMPTVLVFLLYDTPAPGRGRVCVHTCMRMHPDPTLPILHSSRHQPTHQNDGNAKIRSSHRTAETTTATAPPDCPALSWSNA